MMHLSVEFQCKMALVSKGVPCDLRQRWYEAIYLEPDLSEATEILCSYLIGMSDSDMLDLLLTYGEEGSEAALRKNIRYFSQLYGVDRALPVVESDAVESLACLAGFKGDVLADLCIAVNPQTYTLLDGAALLAVMAHEMWHAWQISSMDRWFKELCGTRIDFDVSPQNVKRQMLYYLNYQNYVSFTDSKELYGRQIVEQEAYCATRVMLERIRMFSEKLFEKAQHSVDMASNAC